MTINITVVTYPSLDPESRTVRVNTDIKLVKAAILYADKVSLVSASSSMLLQMMSLANTPSHQQLDEMLVLIRLLGGDEDTISMLKQVTNLQQQVHQLENKVKRAPKRQDRARLTELRGQLALLHRETGRLWNSELLPVALKTATDAGLDELQQAIGAGLLTVPDLGNLDGGASSEGLTTELMARINFLLTVDPDSLPLFDERIGDVVRTGLRDGFFGSSDRTLTHARRAAVGAGLPTYLPAFTNPPMNEVLSLRAELSGALGRYRTSVREMSSTLEADPFAPDIHVYIADLYEERVVPAMQEIAEALSESRFRSLIGPEIRTQLTGILRGAAVGVTALVGPAIALGVTGAENAQGIPDLIDTALKGGPIVGAGIPVAQAAMDVLNQRAEKRRGIRKHGLFYLYDANLRLSTK